MSDISYCYILKSKVSDYTYNGYTNRIDRRIRQHNKEIKGGAKATSRNGPWEYLAIITATEETSDAFTKVKALSLEWSIRYPTNKRPRPREFSTPEGRIRSLVHVFNNPKFSGFHWNIQVHPDYLQLAQEILGESCQDNTTVSNISLV